MKWYAESWWRARVAVIAALAIAISLVDIANAHVGVNPSVVRANTLETFTIRVPTEKQVPTIAVRIEFPTGLIVSRFQPKPGWERTVEKDESGRTVSATWSGGTIQAEEYDDFVFLARTPKEPGPLVFKSYQTYEGGEIVAWIGGELDDFPASAVQVVATTDAAPTTSGTNIENVPANATQDTSATSDAEQSASDATSTPDLATPLPATSNAVPSATTVVLTPTTEQLPLATMAPISPAGGVLDPDVSLPASNGGSDLPLFVAIVAVVIALVALALAGVALTRRRPA